MTLVEVRNLCEKKLLELGADSFWYWDVGAFVFSGNETTISISGTEYVTSNRTFDHNSTTGLIQQSNFLYILII